jgi:hypothetical protein
MDLEHSEAAPHVMSENHPRVSGHRRWQAAALLLLAVGLWGCGSAPFVDARREAGQKTEVGTSTPDRVAICYSSRGATPREVLALAKTECAKTNRTAVFDGQDDFRCVLLAPTRAFFKCVGK